MVLILSNGRCQCSVLSVREDLADAPSCCSEEMGGGEEKNPISNWKRRDIQKTRYLMSSELFMTADFWSSSGIESRQAQPRTF